MVLGGVSNDLMNVSMLLGPTAVTVSHAPLHLTLYINVFYSNLSVFVAVVYGTRRSWNAKPECISHQYGSPFKFSLPSPVGPKRQMHYG